MGRFVLGCEASQHMFQSPNRLGTSAMGKTKALSIGTGNCRTNRTTINTVRMRGRINVGTKAPARNARRYGWEFIAIFLSAGRFARASQR
jgi:hypothetical protein